MEAQAEFPTVHAQAEQAQAEQVQAEQQQVRTKDQRIAEAFPIIKKLSELKLKASEHPEIRELLQHIQTYIQNGERTLIDIPFPIADVDIKGVLATDLKERVWVKFTRL
jgi:hypothetical protein